MEVFKVWTDLNIKGNALTEIQRFTTMVTQSSKAMTRIQKNLGMLSKEFGVLKMGIAGDNTELKMLGENLTSISRRTSHLTTQTAALSKSLGAVAAQGNAASRSLAVVSGGGGAVGRGRGRRGHGFSHMGAMGLGMVAPEMSLLMSGGAAFAGVAAGGIMLHQGFQQEKQYQQKLAQLVSVGYTPSQIAEVNKFTNSGFGGLSQNTLLRAFVDSQMATQDFSKAKALAGPLAMAAFAAEQTFGGINENQVASLIRFAELQAPTNTPEEIKKWMNVGLQFMALSGGSVSPLEMRTFSRQGASALAGLSPLGMLSLEPLFQAQGGSRAATGFTTGANLFISGQGSNFAKKRINHLISEKVLQGASYDSAGRPTEISMRSDYLKLATTDPYEWLKKVYLPLIQKAGVNTADFGSVQRNMMLDFPTTQARNFIEMFKMIPKIENIREEYNRLPTLEEFYGRATQLPGGAAALTGEAWDKFADAFGKLTSPLVISGLHALTSVLTGLSQVITFFSLSNADKNLVVANQNATVEGLVKQSPVLNAMLGHAKSPAAKTLNEFVKNTKNYSKDYYNNGFYSRLIKMPEPSRQQAPVIVHTKINLDGRKVADTVTTHQANTLNAAGTISSPTSVNASLSPTPVGLSNYGGQQ